MSEHFENVPDALRKRRLLVGIVFLALLAVAILGMGKLRMDMTIEGWFHKEDPTLVAFHRYHQQFGSEDGVYIVYKPKDGDVFSPASLEAVRGIQNDLINFRSRLKEGEESALEHIVKVDTLVNASVLTVDGDLLISKALVGDTVPTSPEAIAEIKAIAEAEKQLPLQFFSRDHKYGGIHIETDFGTIPVDAEEITEDTVVSLEQTVASGEEAPVEFMPTDQADYLKLFEEIKTILGKPEYANQFDFYAVGNTAAAEHDVKMSEEMGILYMAAFGIIMVLLWFLFRSVSAVLWSMLIVILSTILTLGVTGWLGLTVTGFLILTILLILTVGVADSVHALTGYTRLRRSGIEHQAALRRAYKFTGVALLLTGLTNMTGTMALNITPVVPIQSFAIMSTLGILFALLLTFYLLPVLVDVWPTVSKKKVIADTPEKKRFLDVLPRLRSALDKAVPFVEKRPVAFIVPFMLVLVLSIYGATQVKIDSQILDQYPADSTFTQSVKVADDHMMGAYAMVLYLDFKEDFALQDPDVLKAMDELQQKFESKYEKYVVMTNSIAYVAKDANRKLNGNIAEFERIPDTRERLSQTLFLFNNANPSERQRLVDDSYRKANIKISLHSYGSYEYDQVFQQMRADIDEMMATLNTKYPRAEVSITGIFALAMQASQYITENQVITFGIALIVVSAILLLVFGSLKVGMIALIPNLIPALLTLGVLGIAGVPLDFFTMMLAPIIIGISVDDTVHFISHYQQQLAKDNNVNAALRRTMAEAGPGVVFTALILGLGFGIMAVASAAGTSNMGKFGALAIFMGLLNDLFLLPALLLKFKPEFKSAPAAGPVAEVQGAVEEGAAG
ncbi:efflux RND transporter permease subunit [Pseudomarimonas arenosa]|uniref:MMPL family transporter n=1 Tax=Pseudomarimonas arenosa TaxID=2774145 RepID=A0AAW3ZL47_9GAMM|nr:MMPL family transporter [Pseudomarimonas arenosa]MBD8525912.1 MMPL family transporter [Pseudomarimonas arenosa]